jgi:hypothetical protein
MKKADESFIIKVRDIWNTEGIFKIEKLDKKKNKNSPQKKYERILDQ